MSDQYVENIRPQRTILIKLRQWKKLNQQKMQTFTNKLVHIIIFSRIQVTLRQFYDVRPGKSSSRAVMVTRYRAAKQYSPNDSRLKGKNLWCSHLANASKAAPVIGHDQWVRLPAWGFLLVFYSDHSLKMHHFWARDMGQTARQTTFYHRMGCIKCKINGMHNK